MSLTVDTARDVLLAAFEDMVVRMDEETLTSSDEQTGIRYINWIMADLAANGVDLGFTKLTKINDPITIPEGAIMALTSILAHKLWPKYRTTEPSANTIILNSRQARTQMFKIGVSIAATEYPSTLPIGSGNDYPSATNSTFYSDLEDTILDEQNGSISLEDSTND